LPKTPRFLSWSGERTKAVASALLGWLKRILQTTEPWFSREIDAGAPWSPEIGHRLSNSSVGIICVTMKNRSAASAAPRAEPVRRRV
jgi:hypothetical protein